MSAFAPRAFALTALVALAGALAAPLAAYVLMVGLFGLPHVLCELRYCDERFSSRAPRGALPVIACLLAVLVGLRLSQGFGLIPSSFGVPAELSVALGLTAAALWHMKRFVLPGALIGGAIACGATLAPVSTLLVAAWLHNLTPLGFIAEILPARDRPKAIGLLCIPFFVLPLIVASGLPQALIHALSGYVAADAPSVFGAGRAPLSAFLTGDLAAPNIVTLFSGALVAQAMHYFAVIVVMPRLLRAGGRAGEAALVRWPRWPVFYLAVGAVGVAMLAFHAADYKTARIFYSTAAAIHSWIELPIFLLAVGLGFSAASGSRSRPSTMPGLQAPTG